MFFQTLIAERTEHADFQVIQLQNEFEPKRTISYSQVTKLA